MPWKDLLESVPRWMLRAAAVGAVLLVAIQMWRGEALVCANGAVFAKDCAAVPEPTNVPIGTILPYFGRDVDIPHGWVLCDGRENPRESLISLDANEEREGIQLPDLSSRFIRGASEPLNPNHLRVGGSDEIDLSHTHLWARTNDNLRWLSYNLSGDEYRVDDWGDGHSTDGTGGWPLHVRANTRLYTQQVGEEVSNLPSYVELRHIIRIF